MCTILFVFVILCSLLFFVGLISQAEKEHAMPLGIVFLCLIASVVLWPILIVSINVPTEYEEITQLQVLKDEYGYDYIDNRKVKNIHELTGMNWEEDYQLFRQDPIPQFYGLIYWSSGELPKKYIVKDGSGKVICVRFN